MSKQTLLLCALLTVSKFFIAQSDERHSVIDLALKAQNSIEGNLNTGAIMPLEWATNSSVACFPSTRLAEFRGNHVLYRINLPASSEVTVTVTPKNKKDRINVYALRFGADSLETPPDNQRAISCEAAYTMYAGKPNYKTANKAKSVSLMSIQKEYTILIGVAGTVDVLEGDYELDIEIVSR